MGLGGLPVISEQLIEHGMEPNTPVAVIYKATQPEQQILISNLSQVAEQVVEQKFKTPSILIIGQVVNLRNRLFHQVSSEKNT